MNSTSPFWRASVSHLPRLVARERVNAGDAVRDIAIQCRVLDVDFPQGTLLAEVLTAVQDRLSTADREATEAFFGALRVLAQEGRLAPADQEGVDRCMVQLRGHVIRRMHPHVLTTLTAFAPRLNFLRRREDVPSPGRGQLDGMLSVVDAWRPQDDPIAQLRRLVLTDRAADMEGLALHRAIGLVDQVHSTRNAMYFNSVLMLIIGSGKLPALMRLKLMDEVMERMPLLPLERCQQRVRAVCLSHLCAIAEKAHGDEAIGLRLLEISLRLLRAPQRAHSRELLRELEQAASRMGRAGLPTVAMAVRTMAAYQIIAWQEQGGDNAQAADADMLVFVRGRALAFLGHPPRPDDGFEFLFEAICLGLENLRERVGAVDTASALLSLLPVAQDCHCLQHAEALMGRLGVVWPPHVQGRLDGEGANFLLRKRRR